MKNLFYGWTDLFEKKKSGFKKEEPEGKKAEFQSEKSRVPSYTSIGDALVKGDYGLIFTTPKSKDIYVITRGTWGEKSKDKVVKGFPGGTSIDTIKSYGKRTKVKHGPLKAPTSTADAGKKGFATRKMKDLKKRKAPLE